MNMIGREWKQNKYDSVESLQSHMILTMSHWSSGLTCLLPATRDTGSNPLGRLMCNRDSPASVVSLQQEANIENEYDICTKRRKRIQPKDEKQNPAIDSLGPWQSRH
jgi:hypothetical protein